MIGKVYRIVGTFNPNVGMTLAAGLDGGVAYGYKRTSWPEIQKWSKAREFYFLELESQKSFSHLKKMPNLKHFIIEDTDILLPEYGSGSFEVFANEIKSLIMNHGMNVYFNSTWKEEQLSKALEKVGINVHPWSTEIANVKKEEVLVEPVIVKPTVEKIIEKKETVVEKKEPVVKKEEKKEIKVEEPKVNKKVEEVKVERKPEVKKIEEKVEKKDIIKVEEKKIFPPKEQKQIIHNGETKQPIPDDLELFYSQPKTKWQKMKAYLSRKIEKLVNNF